MKVGMLNTWEYNPNEMQACFKHYFEKKLEALVMIGSENINNRLKGEIMIAMFQCASCGKKWGAVSQPSPDIPSKCTASSDGKHSWAQQ